MDVNGVAAPAPAPAPAPITIREVWVDNLQSEFELISEAIDQYPYVSVDTEFPGTIYKNSAPMIPVEKYKLMKRNVDVLHLIQVGITLSDSDGNLPNLGSVNHRYIWQFNFSDFDLSRDRYAQESIDLLHWNGINFEENRVRGIGSRAFGELLISSGLVCNSSVSWITFHGLSDFGYLLKILMGNQELPDELPDFLKNLKLFFGNEIYDVKHLMKFCPNLYGGLNSVASLLGVIRMVGNSHQAGSDSLLTWHVFQRMRDIYFADGEGPREHAGIFIRVGITRRRADFSVLYDVKHLMKFCPNLYGGLNRVASILGVNRVIGEEPSSQFR
ncbi:hypothetical protein HAX54_043389 [Datura stramonium]|uniref:poly(A)-specific ribonuclease n=1 Tax=Datura stramonium TaxID=4076 RepID=A0ABS8SN23_DATST|nr:hypothetical protein [Datura stramonium]